MKQSDFRLTNFDSRKNLEFRFEDNVVCIYGTPDRLRDLAREIVRLADHPREGHIHLEYPVHPLVTKESADAAVAVFPLDDKSK